jgi:hypothetical protein
MSVAEHGGLLHLSVVVNQSSKVQASDLHELSKIINILRLFPRLQEPPKRDRPMGFWHEPSSPTDALCTQISAETINTATVSKD